jgi:diaminopimelate decarboxylase
MWISKDQALSLVSQHGSPLFVYDTEQLRERARQLMELNLPYGHTVRYAVKANPHPEIIKLFDASGLHFDASSSYEAVELLQQGIPGAKISLSSQQPAHNLPELLDAGVLFVATSMHQLRLFAEAAPSGASLALRVNPGIGDGHNNRNCTGGVGASFGVWHAYLEDALALASEHGLATDRLHVHIGSGAKPSVWRDAVDTALKLAARMPAVTMLDIGGGYKVSRAAGEQEADMQAIARVFGEQLASFAAETGRKIHLEIEPGTWLVAHAGVLLAGIADIVDTGPEGYNFLRLNTGMNDIIRPTLYGAQHRITVLNNAAEQIEYVVVGHNCETSDILTPAPGDSEHIAPRRMNQATIGDLVAIADAGAYCASLSAKGYNAYPSAQEVFV